MKKYYRRFHEKKFLYLKYINSNITRDLKLGAYPKSQTSYWVLNPILHKICVLRNCLRPATTLVMQFWVRIFKRIYIYIYFLDKLCAKCNWIYFLNFWKYFFPRNPLGGIMLQVFEPLSNFCLDWKMAPRRTTYISHCT